MESNTISDKRLDKVSVKVHIGGKDYPITVNREDEQKVLQAAALLNEQVAKYKNGYNIIEKQDLFAIVAFDAVFDRLTQEEKNEKMMESLSIELDHLTQQLDS